MSFQKGGSLVGSVNRILGSSLGHSQLPHRISYPDGWRTGPTEAWYKDQPCTKFTQLQYRKERAKPWEHEYILVELDNGTVCRFDRRARTQNFADAFTSEGLDAEDTAHVIHKSDKEHYYAIINDSDLVLCMHFPDGQDILSILSICYGIQQDRETECYSLIRYNCYFFSWMMVTALARRTVDWALLGSNDQLWDELVNATMTGLQSDSSKLGQLKSTTRAILGKTPNHAAPPFSGSSYLLSILHIALHHTRSNIETSLTELLLKSTVEKTMHEIANASAKSAAEDAARSHASQAARDASFEAVMEVMWKTMLSDPEGAQLWEDRCRRTEACVRKAALAASDAALMLLPLTPPATPPSTPLNDSESEISRVRESWEDAWDSTWNENWLAGQTRVKPKDEPATSRIALLAKAAWSKAWKDACLANEEYVPLVSQGVTKYVMNHLPETSIKIGKPGQGAMKRMMKSLVSSDTSNSELQTFIQTRIAEFVARVLRVLPRGTRTAKMSFSAKPNSAKPSTGGSFTNSSSFVGSLSKLSASSYNGRTQDPHIINFTTEGNGWRKGGTEEWYRKQPSTRFDYLEYRKEREYPFYHEYILVHLGNETVCRFDRRGDVNNRANVLVGEPIPSEDSAHVIAKNDDKFYPAIENNSDLLLRMHFPKGQDIITILAICYGIQSNKATQAYSLTRYNCYFFSWMIITATARFTVNWESLADENKLWETLVTSVMDGLNSNQAESGLLTSAKAIALPTLGIKGKTDPSVPAQFVGSVYLCNTLRSALVQTRGQISKSLAELILHSTVDKAMHELSETSAQNAGTQAARNHASQAASDAAMEAVIETMWQVIITDPQGGKLWKSKCNLVKACVEAASTAAASAAETTRHHVIIAPTENTAEAQVAETGSVAPSPASEGAEIPAPPAKWETAWVTTWETRWKAGTESEPGTESQAATSDETKTAISNRAKAAWIKAWDDAWKANERYVPLISRGVATYVTKNLPEALPEVLQYGTETSTIKNMVKALSPGKFEGSSNSKLQDWVKARITDHCARVLKMSAGTQQPSKVEFEDTMKSIWESTVRCLIDSPKIAVELGKVDEEKD
ncbi:unnamed protein product [Rhizoctonia solani]|uniref:Uncharacterized protein n=1 Tax=Rhizoctonia solani TaxID=456999 RepID=A0A8H2WH12_9AGAM|nr:unnamed protein product [Rhizoctonia solani]